ncbi:MAG: hypothetical protein IIV78_02385 [Oscillospiraceae bacterium]|nr:hypothetical protein [Oscillospiraceae bacterium]
MLCVTSCFNKTLFKKNLQRFWPLWLGYALIWFVILPLIQFSDLLYGHMNGNTLAVSRTILETSVIGGLIMGVIFGLLFAMAEFSYLSNGRATQGLHALSSRRETFYITNYLSGLFCQLSTLAATFVLTGMITLFNLTFDLSALVRGFLICTLFVVFFYSFGVFCMMFSGQALAAPVFYGILNFLSIAMETLLRTFAGSFLYGYNDSLNEMYTDFLCPVWMFADNVDIRTIHETQPMLNNAGVYEMQHVTVGYELEGFGIILAYALVGVVLAVLGLLVYRRRASEETGTVVAIPWARPIFKYGVALCAAFSAGQLLYYLLFGNYVGSNKLFLPGMLGCITVAGLLGFFAAEMLLKKRFNVFRSSLGGAIAVVSALVIIGVGMSFDPTGYETYTPDAEDVEYVYVNFYSDGVDFYEEVYDKETIEALITAHKAVIAEKDKMLSYRDGNYGHVNDDLIDDSYFHFSVRYYLDNDREVRRQYNGGHILREELADPTSFASAITEFINMPEASYTRTLGRNFGRAGEVGSTITGGRVHGWYGTQTYNDLSNELTAAQAREVYATLLLDMEIGNTRKTSVFYSKENERYVDLELWYNYTEEAISDIKYVTDTTVAVSEQGNASLHLTVRKEMKNTVALLKSFGYLPEGF